MKIAASFAAAALLFMLGMAKADESAGALAFGTIEVGSTVRSYALDHFKTAGTTMPVPIIVFLHGSETDIRKPIPPRFDVDFTQVPGMEPALIVLPQGADGRWAAKSEGFEPLRLLWRWATGRSTSRPDEVAFIDALVAKLIAQEHGDPARVYVVGVSSGGSMTLRLACAPHQPFAAYAAVLATAGAAGMPACVRETPVSLLLLASTTDPIVSYRGRDSEGPLERLSVPETVVGFVERDHCTARAETPLPHTDVASPSTVSLIRYGGCAAGHEVLFYRVDGSGHSVPSLRPPEAGGWVENGARNRDIETSERVWDFLRTQRRAE